MSYQYRHLVIQFFHHSRLHEAEDELLHHAMHHQVHLVLQIQGQMPFAALIDKTRIVFQVHPELSFLRKHHLGLKLI